MTLQSRKISVMTRKYLGVLIVMMAMLSWFSEAKCKFEAIFNFGDSNTETGGFWAAFPPQNGPFGMTYFRRPSGRASDGRSSIDFLAQAFGYPFLSPYLQSLGSDFRHGVNYAIAGCTVLVPNTSNSSPFPLPVQLNQMKEFKARVIQYHSSCSKIGSNKLPAPDVFGKSLYTLYIGQNDFTGNLGTIGIDGVKQYLPRVISQIAYTVKINNVSLRYFHSIRKLFQLWKEKMTLLSRNISAMLRKFLVVWIVMMATFSRFIEPKCEFEAIFNFGDSNTDTGGFFAAYPAESGPFGMTYFKRPAGRASDGRLIVDFLAQALGLPFLSPYLQSVGSDYRHGVNYATLASTVLWSNTTVFVSGISPFSLPIQLHQMQEFKAKVDELNPSCSKSGSNYLPSPQIFGKSLYTFYIGQNDFTSNLAEIGIAGVKQYLPQVVSQLAYTIQEIYALGGRTFLVLNLAPIGCYPAFLVELPHNNSDIDHYGCLISYNNAVMDYNKMLNETLAQTRSYLSNASIIYVDIHSVLLDLFQHPTSKGLKYGTKACCGHGGGAYNFDARVYCGNTKVINGSTVTATACKDPYNYVSWDGIHATEAANKIMTRAILSGSLFDPPFPLHQLCDLQPIG